MLEIREPEVKKAKPEVVQRPKKDERHSYYDLKADMLDKNQYNPKFELVHSSVPTYTFRKEPKKRPLTAVVNRCHIESQENK